MLAGVGALFIAYGFFNLRGGAFSYLNYYSIPVFSPAVIVTGAFLCALAFLPPSTWVYPLITTKKRRSSGGAPHRHNQSS
ncbi:MAG: hypothetical protein ACRD3E_11505 [Terriglobales bacterium]